MRHAASRPGGVLIYGDSCAPVLSAFSGAFRIQRLRRLQRSHTSPNCAARIHNDARYCMIGMRQQCREKIPLARNFESGNMRISGVATKGCCSLVHVERRRCVKDAVVTPPRRRSPDAVLGFSCRLCHCRLGDPRPIHQVFQNKRTVFRKTQ